jgi:arylamine N-acetyltransferase
MSAGDHHNSAIDAIQALMLAKFRTEPFHNLRMLYDVPHLGLEHGGTCSDKTLSFLAAAKQAGFDASLHSAFIGGQEIHRLTRIRIDDRTYFADMGSGWPSLHLYPTDEATHYRCYGMRFRTELRGSRVLVYHERKGRESLQVEIEVFARPEAAIRKDIARRFMTGVEHPFSNALRFSQVVGDEFLFLRGDTLEFHHESGYREIPGLRRQDAAATIRKYFGRDVSAIVNSATGPDLCGGP